MKVIITGPTGLVGGALVRESIANQSISHLYVLTRRPLPEDISKNQKVTTITHDDFSSYPPELVQQLTGAQACLWAIGGRVPQFPDVETCRRVQVDYTLMAADAFIEHLAPGLTEGEKFKFVFCSGKYAEWDQQKSLYFMSDTRHIKGQVEEGLCKLSDAHKDRFEVWCVRPSGILDAHASLFSKMTGTLYGATTNDVVARAMIELALKGYPERIIESDKIAHLAMP